MLIANMTIFLVKWNRYVGEIANIVLPGWILKQYSKYVMVMYMWV